MDKSIEKKKTKRKSWLHYLNYFVVQLFFIRIARCIENRVEDYQLISYNFMPDGSVSSRGTGVTKKYQRFAIIGFILPFTGWNTDFKYLGKERQWNITKFKEVEPVIEPIEKL